MTVSVKPKKALALAALGVVYGDIGTSPLYTMKEIFSSVHHQIPAVIDNVLGLLSVIFWSLIVVVSGKYLILILRADNNGEGGIMALMALALRGEGANPTLRKLILIIGLFGAALFFGDGVVTPAISVLSAVEGLQVAAPSLDAYVIPITLTVLMALFFVQSRGTASVGRMFGPIMLIWFVTLGILGLLSILRYPAVLYALNPWFALKFSYHHPEMLFFSLGSVILALTGAEALYADMGHFGRSPIRRAWFALVLPCLALNYFGQGALIILDPSSVENPFFRLVSGVAVYPLVILSTLATVIASQAVISGAFSVATQAIRLGFLPRLKIFHTSDSEIGQVYLPVINYLQLSVVMLLVIGFQSSTNLASAYGIAVTGTMFISTLLALVVSRKLWKWGMARSLLVFGTFLLIDWAFFLANAVKIMDGGWFPLAFALVIFLIMLTWYRGQNILEARAEQGVASLDHFIQSVKQDDAIVTVPGTAVFMSSSLNTVPSACLHNLKHNKVLHERILFIKVSFLDVPRLPSSSRVVVVEKVAQRFVKVQVFYGFMEDPDLMTALEWLEEQLPEFNNDSGISFFIGRDTPITSSVGRGELSFWQEKLFIWLHRNSRGAADFFRLPSSQIVELGSQVVL